MEGQVAIVTGGANGIGKEFVKVLLARKIKVCIADINEEQAKATIQELTTTYKDVPLIYLHCDVTKKDEFEDVFRQTQERLGRPDILLNNAGILDESRRQLMIDINLNGVIYGTQLGLKYMDKNNGGNGGLIVNMSSVAGLCSVALAPYYALTKHAVLGYSRSIGASSLSSHGVRVNAICPQGAKTALMELTQEKLACSDETFAAFSKSHESNVLIEPRQVAECLIPLMDDVTKSGAAILCIEGEPPTELDMPVDLASIKKCYIRNENKS